MITIKKYKRKINWNTLKVYFKATVLELGNLKSYKNHFLIMLFISILNPAASKNNIIH